MSPSVLDEDRGTSTTTATASTGRKTGAIDGVAGASGASSVAAAPARPSNVTRATPASQCTPPPDAVPLHKRKAYTQSGVDRLAAALVSFSAPDEDSLPNVGEAISPHHMPEVEDLFSLIARVGNPMLPWETIRPVFLWKIRHVMEEMVRVERLIDAREKEERVANDHLDVPPPVAPPHQVKGGVPYRPPAEGWEDDSSDLRESYRFVLGKAASFTAAPFTIQRLCELLENPLKQYKKAETLFRALEKCINVVTCVTDDGLRITGVEDLDNSHENSPPLDDEAKGRIEARFFGKIDELDGGDFNPITTVAANAEQRRQHESGDGSATKAVDDQSTAGGDAVVNGDVKME